MTFVSRWRCALRTLSRTSPQCLALFMSLLLAACGGGGGGSSAPITVSLPPSLASIHDSNVAQIMVQAGPNNNVNIPYVSVTVCTAGGALGTSACKTIDNVLLDTGSTGLRLFANQVTSAVTLPPQTVGASSAIYECANFLNTNAWGRVRVADIVIGTSGERASNVPIQLMDANDAGYVKCNNAPLMSTVTNNNAAAPPLTDSLSANGILGLGLFVNDGQNYFDCTVSGAGCTSIFPVATKQVQNPVALFGVTSGNVVANNNGVVLQLPVLPLGYATSAAGYLIFGVGTQSNNRLGTANVLPLNAFHHFTTVYKGRSFTSSFLDSGSNGFFFDDATLQSPACTRAAPGFYCATNSSLTAAIQLTPSTSVTVGIPLASADTLFYSPSGNYAFSNLGGSITDPAFSLTPPSSSFDWGLPFFFGRSVYTVIEGKTAGSQTGPFNAFTN